MNIEELKNQVFIGVVVDNNDPKKQGRCRCRVLNVFNDIAVEDIPWAKPWKDLNGNQFIVPELNKIVSVVFDSGNPYKPEYIYADHYNQNLQAKLDKLNVEDYKSMRALMFDNRTQIYSNNTEGLMIDHVFHNINIREVGIDVNLKDETGRLNLGDSRADESVILGTTFIEWFETFLNALTGEGAGPYLGNLGTPVVMNPYFANVILQFKNLNESEKILSNNVFVPKNRTYKTVSDNSPNRINITSLGDQIKTTNKNIEIEVQQLSQNTPRETNGPAEDPTANTQQVVDATQTTENNKKLSDPVYFDNRGTITDIVVSDFANKLVKVALNEEGVKEDAATPNKGEPRVNEFIKYAHNVNINLEAEWCACFVSWCFGQVPKQFPGTNYNFTLPKIPACINWLNSFGKRNANYIETFYFDDGSYKNYDGILPGDIIIFAFSHIGIAIEKKPSTTGTPFKTIEGNTYAEPLIQGTGRNGDRVAIRNRKLTWGPFIGKKWKTGGQIYAIFRIKYNPDKVKKVN